MQTCSLGGLAIGGDAPVRLMGVINCSPESFFSGSYVAPDRVGIVASQFAASGADIIDVGARSTALNAPPISAALEKERVTAALKSLDGTGVRVSIDTMCPEVLEACIRYGIDAVNDIRGLADPAMAALIADAGLPVIAMAACRRPGDPLGVEETLRALARVLERAERHGIRDIILDPGIGRWTEQRTAGHDWDLCRNFALFQTFERPLIAAVSRKSFLGDLLKKPPAERLAGSLAVTCFLLEQGAAIVRAHDVVETRDCISVFERMQEGL
ncbi:MAG: dihydropteroate synthase [Methanomicrobiales archaeon]|nr:dihydropteroate synthase [Methanomicrobiales archaeon]